MSEEFWRASCEFWRGMFERTLDERDEARAIAGELARFIRAMLDEYDFPYSPFVLGLMDEWRAIRPGVRKWLEGK
jgi:hypothetical protein